MEKMYSESVICVHMNFANISCLSFLKIQQNMQREMGFQSVLYICEDIKVRSFDYQQ